MNAAARSCRRAFFPLAHFNQVDPRLVQAELRHMFSRWGQPGAVRVDNGSPWGSSGDWPTALALWLIGLGLDMIWNDACRPQQNGVVERSQGTGKRWAEPGQCDTPAALQNGLDDTDRLQREHYPYRGTASRLTVYPQLVHSGRVYQAAHETQTWQWQRALDHLADYLQPRQVDRSGTISVLNRTQYVGKTYAGQTVWVRFDPVAHHWILADGRGTQIRVKEAPELSAANICQLQVAGKK